MDRLLHRVEQINILGITGKLEQVLALLGQAIEDAEVKKLSDQTSNVLTELLALRERFSALVDDTRPVLGETRKALETIRATVDRVGKTTGYGVCRRYSPNPSEHSGFSATAFRSLGNTCPTP